MSRFVLGRRFSYDMLSTMSDGELQSVLKGVRSSIQEHHYTRKCTKYLEVECCYIQKEIDDRLRYSGERLDIKKPRLRRSTHNR